MVKLLVVDPYPIVSKGLELVFETTRDVSFIGTLSDGEAIFDFLKHNKVDVILCEIDLPKLNGITALRKIRKEYPDVRVIIFSTQPEEVYALNAIKLGAAGYLSKTTDIITIKDAIIKAYMGNTYLSEAMTKRLMQSKKSSEGQSFFKKLSNREIEVLKLLTSGKRNKEIAQELDINEKTVSTYRARLMKKLNVTNLVDLVNQAKQLAL
ncbi:response regulator transcription factor [Lacinutrix sp. 5H-3-7-4]|uniref:response regulator n=1 Tax=Lacinutrix sp. (strain 5H-3-7-4) TaxID=983544 RepID=UPI00020A36E9|nr:response regulator transcription factor [Lacinutrix sp. 5H-3-7-4]AEH00290.1 two component transcriptional regulator, LuxR family [Lacinutrix sp. 5H-3-7-4]